MKLFFACLFTVSYITLQAMVVDDGLAKFLLDTKKSKNDDIELDVLSPELPGKPKRKQRSAAIVIAQKNKNGKKYSTSL